MESLDWIFSSKANNSFISDLSLHSNLKGTSLNMLFSPTISKKGARNLESVSGSVIQATGTVEFEDGLRTGVLQEDSWCPYSGRATLESDMAMSWRPALTQVCVV